MKLLITLLFALTMQAQTTIEALHYLVRQPKIKAAHPPVLFLLHGVGSNEKDLFSFAENLPDKYLVISARGPLTLRANRYGWFHVDFKDGKPNMNFEEQEASRKLLITFISQMQQKFSFDAGQVYLCGFSQGGIMSYSIALTHPELIKGIAVMSGRLLPEIKTLAAPDAKLKKLDIFISHGTADNVLTIDWAHAAKAYLEEHGLTPNYHEYAGAGHEINKTMFADLLAWLNK